MPIPGWALRRALIVAVPEGAPFWAARISTIATSKWPTLLSSATASPPWGSSSKSHSAGSSNRRMPSRTTGWASMIMQERSALIVLPDSPERMPGGRS